MNELEFRRLVRAQIGDRYVFGHEVSLSDKDPETWDCSELVQWAYARAGVTIADGSFNQYPACKAVDGPLQIGDLFFLKDSSGKVFHVGIYVGKSPAGVPQVVEARGRAYGVVETTVSAIKARGGIWRRYPKFDAQISRAATSAPVEYQWVDFTCVDANKAALVSACDRLDTKLIVRDGDGFFIGSCHASSAKLPALTAAMLTLGCSVCRQTVATKDGSVRRLVNPAGAVL